MVSTRTTTMPCSSEVLSARSVEVAMFTSVKLRTIVRSASVFFRRFSFGPTSRFRYSWSSTLCASTSSKSRTVMAQPTAEAIFAMRSVVNEPSRPAPMSVTFFSNTEDTSEDRLERPRVIRFKRKILLDEVEHTALPLHHKRPDYLLVGHGVGKVSVVDIDGRETIRLEDVEPHKRPPFFIADETYPVFVRRHLEVLVEQLLVAWFMVRAAESGGHVDVAVPPQAEVIDLRAASRRYHFMEPMAAHIVVENRMHAGDRLLENGDVVFDRVDVALVPDLADPAYFNGAYVDGEEDVGQGRGFKKHLNACFTRE